MSITTAMSLKNVVCNTWVVGQLKKKKKHLAANINDVLQISHYLITPMYVCLSARYNQWYDHEILSGQKMFTSIVFSSLCSFKGKTKVNQIHSNDQSKIKKKKSKSKAIIFFSFSEENFIGNYLFLPFTGMVQILAKANSRLCLHFRKYKNKTLTGIFTVCHLNITCVYI